MQRDNNSIFFVDYYYYVHRNEEKSRARVLILIHDERRATYLHSFAVHRCSSLLQN